MTLSVNKLVNKKKIIAKKTTATAIIYKHFFNSSLNNIDPNNMLEIQISRKWKLTEESV